MQLKTTDVLNKMETFEGILSGMKKVNALVEKTMGAKGSHILFDDDLDRPFIINDGINILRKIKLEDRLESMGHKLILNASENTSKKAGDSTSATCLLTTKLIERGYEALKNGYNPVLLSKGISSISEEIATKLEEKAVEIKNNDELYDVAFVSSRDENISRLVVEAIEFSGDMGAINVMQNHKRINELEKTRGMHFPIPYRHRALCNNKKENITEMDNLHTILIDVEFNRAKQFYPVLTLMLKHSKAINEEKDIIKRQQYLIIANSTTDEIVETLIDNLSNKEFYKYVDVQIVHTPTTNNSDLYEHLEDIQCITGGEIVTAQAIGKEELDMSVLGKLKLAQITEKSTLLQGYTKEEACDDELERIDTRVKYLKEKLDDKELINTELLENKLKQRIARLTSGFATIKLYAQTEIEFRDKLEKCDDALRATRSAKEEGVIVGGWVAARDIYNEYLALEVSNENKTAIEEGKSIVLNSIIEPYETILRNAGFEDIEIDLPIGIGYDVNSNEKVDMFKAGILDPLKSIRFAFLHAVANSQMALRLAGSVITKDDDKNG